MERLNACSQSPQYTLALTHISSSSFFKSQIRSSIYCSSITPKSQATPHPHTTHKMTSLQRTLSASILRALQQAVARRQQQQQRHFFSSTTIAAAAAGGGAAKQQQSAARRLGLAGVQHVIAVASGKGGVGKSTVAGACSWRQLRHTHPKVNQVCLRHHTHVPPRLTHLLCTCHSEPCHSASPAPWLAGWAAGCRHPRPLTANNDAPVRRTSSV